MIGRLSPITWYLSGCRNVFRLTAFCNNSAPKGALLIFDILGVNIEIEIIDILSDGVYADRPKLR